MSFEFFKQLADDLIELRQLQAEIIKERDYLRDEVKRLQAALNETNK